MMKKSLSSAVCGVMAMVAVGAANAADPEYTIRYASASPPGSQTSVPIRWFAEEIEKRSDGRVKLEFFWNGSLVKGPDVLNAVGSGIVPMGKIYTVDHSGQMPLNQIFNLPFTVDDVYVIQKTVDDMHEKYPELVEEFTKQNVKRLGGLATGTVHLLSREPIKNLDDLNGQNIRARGVQAEALKAVGAIPVSVPFGDLYEALDRGIIDTTIMYELSVMPYKFNEIADNFTYVGDVGLGHAIQGEIMNLDYWNKLPEDVQQLISETMRDAHIYYADTFAEKLAKETKQMETGDGTAQVTFHELPEDELKQWQETSQTFYNQWAEENKGRGSTDEMLTSFRELLDTRTAAVDSSGYPKY